MADKILNGFDVWISAQGLKSKGRLRNVDNISLEGIQRLRELILDLAIRGKLVSQDTNEEPARILVKRLSVKEKTKKDVLGPIDEEEKFIDLPIGWEWVKLGSIGDTNIGLTYSPNNVSGSGTPVLRSSNIQDGKISFDDIVRVSGDIAEKNFVENGDLLICARNGSKSLVGKCAIIPQLNERMAFGAFMAILRSDINDYVKIFLESPHYRSRLEGVSTTTINQITQDNLKNTVIPLPPLAEQHRIVAKVDELMALCDELEQQETHHLKSHQLLVETFLGTLTRATDAADFQQAWNKLQEHFDDLFTTEDSIDQLKQTILQLAVMGKLVPQDPNDEPAGELLKTKKVELKLPEVQGNKMPFSLPFNWSWQRLGSIVEFIGGSQPPKGKFIHEEREGYVRLVQIRDFKSDDFKTYIPKENANRPFSRDDIMIGRYGPPVFQILRGLSGTYNVALMKAIPSELLLKDYCFYLLKEKRIQNIVIEDSERTAGQSGVRKPLLESIIIGLPPLKEQKKIVQKIEELFALCDSLKERIAEAQKIANQMAEAVVEFV